MEDSTQLVGQLSVHCVDTHLMRVTQVALVGKRPSRSWPWTIALLTAVLISVDAVSPARATEEWSFEVFQPIWTMNDEITVSRATVVTFSSGDVGVSSVLATCDSSIVATDYGPQERNAAFDAGLRVEVTFNSEKDPPLFGDTLRVTLHATDPAAATGDFDYGTIIAATVQCILASAAQSPAIKFVSLRIDGEKPYRAYGGVFPLKRFRNGPTRRVFT